jgi:hypothetical protein
MVNVLKIKQGVHHKDILNRLQHVSFLHQKNKGPGFLRANRSCGSKGQTTARGEIKIRAVFPMKWME